MRNAIVGLLLAFLLIAVPQAADWADVIKQAENAVVFAQVGASGGCTAFVINTEKKYLLTAAHCKPQNAGESLWVDLVPSKLISYDVKKDLMVLEAEHLNPARIALRLAASNPVRGQEVMSVGYGFALERPFFRKASVQDDKFMLPEGGVGGPFISTDSPFVGGQSGGPVLNLSGEIVAIVQRGDGGTTGLGVGAEIIRERMGRFFGK